MKGFFGFTKIEVFILFFLFIFWFAGDLLTTFLGLAVGGTEANPLFSWLTLESFWVLVLVKLVGFLLIFFFGYRYRESRLGFFDRWTWTWISLPVFTGFFVVLWNFLGLLVVLTA